MMFRITLLTLTAGVLSQGGSWPKSVLPLRQKANNRAITRASPLALRSPPAGRNALLPRNVADNGPACKWNSWCWQGYQTVNHFRLTQLRREKISEVFRVACRHHLDRVFPMFFRLMQLGHNSSQTLQSE
jgi:hypothetical protein